MIDWISVVVNCDCDRKINGNKVFCVNSETGVVEWEFEKGVEVEGSHSAKTLIKTLSYNKNENTASLYISGNPAKFLQGHNLFGSDDLQGLTYSYIQGVLETLGIGVSDRCKTLMADGVYELKRVDCTASYALPCREDVRSWIRAASQVATARHQKKSAYSEQTLYFGKNSRRISLKAYCKGDELEVHHLPLSLFEMDSEKAKMLTEYANPLLRVEITLRAMELKRRGLDRGFNWKYNIGDKFKRLAELSNTPQTIIEERVKELKLPEKFKLNTETLKGLSPRVQMAYKCWLEGTDMRTVLPRKTFYRYRLELMKHGIDLSVLQPSKPEKVVPLVRYLIAEPVGIPDWARGTPFYHEPTEHLKYKKALAL